MNKQEAVNLLLHKKNKEPVRESATAFAPTNIALIKYWGKRDEELNLSLTNSLSITLPNKGATTTIKINNKNEDEVFLNHQKIDPASEFFHRLISFLNLFRPSMKVYYQLHTEVNIPVAAGVASSACGFAALVKALNILYDWNCEPSELSILSRLGSGSACRSLWNGFVEWEKGSKANGMDSFGHPLSLKWKGFCVGLLLLNVEKKLISSRKAMRLTKETSPLYKTWPQQVENDLIEIKQHLEHKNFDGVGRVAECNAEAMHLSMKNAVPSIDYASSETLAFIQKIKKLRKEGLSLYYTQDAGPNLKLLFLEKDIEIIQQQFEDVEIIKVF